MDLLIDSHHHFWSPSQIEYPWLDPDGPFGVLHRDWTPTDLSPYISENHVDGTVLVQSADSFEETRFMLRMAEEADWVAGIVGWLPLDRPDDAANALGEMGASSLVGVRHLIHVDPDPSWIHRPGLGDGFRLLAENDLTFDAPLVGAQMMQEFLDLARRHPDNRMVLDHIGNPDIAAGQWSPWSELMAQASELPNLYVKLSGLLTQAGPGWKLEDLSPYVDHVIDCFGPPRILWGSDWPVVNLAADYSTWMMVARQLLSDLSDQDRRWVFGEAAAALYKLELEHGSHGSTEESK